MKFADGVRTRTMAAAEAAADRRTFLGKTAGSSL